MLKKAEKQFLQIVRRRYSKERTKAYFKVGKEK